MADLRAARLLVRACGRSDRFVVVEVRSGRYGRGRVLLSSTVDLRVAGSYLRAVRRLSVRGRESTFLYLDESVMGRGSAWRLAVYPLATRRGRARLLRALAGVQDG